MRRRYPATSSMNRTVVGEWVTIEEWSVGRCRIDMLAMSAWKKALRIGHEIKVSRADYRRELLKPDKRAPAMNVCTQFFFVIPRGLLTEEEIAWRESLWSDGDFERVSCPDNCHRPSARERRYDKSLPRRGTVEVKPVPVPVVIPEPAHPWWRTNIHATPEYLERHERDYNNNYLRSHGWIYISCRRCGGKGYIKGSRVEREATMLWVPSDVGLIEVDGRGCHVTREAPEQRADPLVTSDYQLHQLIRWVSARPDPRHRTINGT